MPKRPPTGNSFTACAGDLLARAQKGELHDAHARMLAEAEREILTQAIMLAERQPSQSRALAWAVPPHLARKTQAAWPASDFHRGRLGNQRLNTLHGRGFVSIASAIPNPVRGRGDGYNPAWWVIRMSRLLPKRAPDLVCVQAPRKVMRRESWTGSAVIGYLPSSLASVLPAKGYPASPGASAPAVCRAPGGQGLTGICSSAVSRYAHIQTPQRDK